MTSLRRLLHVTDYVSFCAVCTTWRSATLRNHVRLPRGIPVLMIPSNNKQEKEETRRFYSLIEKRVYDFQVAVPPKHYCSRSTEYGWLVTVDKTRCSVCLLNPFSRNTRMKFKKQKNEIQLPQTQEWNSPPLTTLPKRTQGRIDWNSCFISKAVLSSNPSSTPDFVVLAIFDTVMDLAFCRPGDKKWTPINREGLLAHVDDAIFYNQKFYVVDIFGKVMACDVNHPHPSLTTVAASLPTSISCIRPRYLARCGTCCKSKS